MPSNQKSIKRNRSINSPTEEQNNNEVKDAEEDLVNCDDEFVVGLDILINKANNDLKRSQEFLSKVSEYQNLCQMTLKELHNCKKSYMKVVTYAYKMSIINSDPEIHYASAIGNAVSITTHATALPGANSSSTDCSAADNAVTTNP